MPPGGDGPPGGGGKGRGRSRGSRGKDRDKARGGSAGAQGSGAGSSGQDNTNPQQRQQRQQRKGASTTKDQHAGPRDQAPNDKQDQPQGQPRRGKGRQSRNRPRGGEGQGSGDGAEKRRAAEEAQRRAAEEAERLRAEAEAAEEARRVAEEIARSKARVDAYLDGLRDAAARCEEARVSSQHRRELRALNLAASSSRPTEDDLGMLDSSMKKNTALIKKLKAIGEESKRGVLQDIARVNQSKYVSEAAAAVGEIHFKQKDVNAVAEVCSALHQRYAEFAPSLIPALEKLLEAPSCDLKDAKDLNRKRNALRLFMELFLVGMHGRLDALRQCIARTSAAGWNKDRDVAQTNLAIVATFAKHGRDALLGPAGGGNAEHDVAHAHAHDAEGEPLAPEDLERTNASPSDVAAAQALLSDARASLVHERGLGGEAANGAQRAHLRGLVQSSFDGGSAYLVGVCKALRAKEAKNADAMAMKGELTDRQREEEEDLRRSFDALHRSLASIAESLGCEMVAMPVEARTKVATDEGSVVIAKGFGGEGKEGEGDAFDDEETRAFYEDLPDLAAQLPAVLLPNQGRVKPEDKGAEDVRGGGVGEGREEREGEEKEGEAKDAEGEGDGEGEVLRSDQQLELDALLTQLQSTVNKEGADRLSLSFCYLNSKGVRKRIVKALFQCPRQHLELLPYYARIAANLSRVVSACEKPTVGEDNDDRRRGRWRWRWRWRLG